MPVKGRKPKPAGQALQPRPVHTWQEVPDLPYEGRVPPLPRRSGGWTSRAKRKWEIWSHMPHCRLWTRADWDFAIDSLEVAERFYAGDRAAATELRNREKVLGTTADYRRDLRIRYVDPDAQDDAPQTQTPAVTKLDDYRDLYGSSN
jgi:hypothetical protein